MTTTTISKIIKRSKKLIENENYSVFVTKSSRKTLYIFKKSESNRLLRPKKIKYKYKYSELNIVKNVIIL